MRQVKHRKLSRTELIERWIERNPNKPSKDEVVIKDYYVPVWALIGYLPMVDGDATRVASGYELPIEAVEAALAYYHRYKKYIDVRLHRNAASFED